MDKHIPVLIDEVLFALRPEPGQNFIDATFGGGGHAAAILKAIRPGGHLVAIDRDPEALADARTLGTDVTAVRANFSSLGELSQYGVPNFPINGVLIDCGISSTQLSDARLGLSFTVTAPLDMRLDRGNGLTAFSIVNGWTERDLANVIWEFGEEPRSRRIASAIVRRRQVTPIQTTTEFAD